MFFDNLFFAEKINRKFALCNSRWSTKQEILPEIKKGKKKAPKVKKQKKPKQLLHGSLFRSKETFNRRDDGFLVINDALVALQLKDSKVVILLYNCMDPSKLTSVERRQKGKSKN